MEIVYYVLTVALAVLNSIGAIGKKYSNAATQRAKFLNVAAFSIITAALTWIIFAFTKEKIDGTVLLFSAIFGVNFVICNYTLYAAMELGSLSKTNLITSLALVISTLAGIFFWHEEFNPWLLAAAMGMMIASLLLIILRKEADEIGRENNKKTKVKWLVFTIVAFITSGLSSVIQKTEQTLADGQGAFAMTALSFTFTALVAFIAYGILCAVQREQPIKKDFIDLAHNKKSIFFNVIGVGVVNLIVTYLSTRVPAAFLYPCIIGGSVIITAVCSALFFKEKMNARIIVGILLGVTAIVLFSL